ncbi:hypothetical protein HDV02_005567 [Globomyces sp. JEL0801]|nr:hypothetical protein HDV02_005567 [Globomyces sp. JEL0801]
MKNTHCLLNNYSIDGAIQFQEMNSQIEAVQLQLKLAEAVVEIGRTQSEVEHLKKLFQTEQKDLKAQLDIQARLLADNDILQCNLENAHLEIDKLRIKLETEERSKIDLKTRLELQGKLLADHSDNLSNAQSQIEKLKNKLEVEVDLKSQLELQGKLIHLSSKTAIFLQVDERSKTDMKMEIDRQGKLLVDQIILQKNLERTQLEIEKLKHTLQVERCAQEEDMDKQGDQEMFLINSDISMEAENSKPAVHNTLYIFSEGINNRKLHIYAGKLSVKLKSIASSNSLKEAFLTVIKDSMKASKKTTSKPDYRFNSAQQLIKNNRKPLNNHFLNKKERNRRCFHTHMTSK